MMYWRARRRWPRKPKVRVPSLGWLARTKKIPPRNGHFVLNEDHPDAITTYLRLVRAGVPWGDIQWK